MSKTIAVKLTNRGEKIIRQGHPWVFSDSISTMKGSPKTGDICILFGRKSNQLYALGLYDEYSPIRIKIIHHQPAKINIDFFKNKIQTAFDKRKSLVSEKTNSFRLVYGESDALPGLIIDVYNQVAVIKIYSSAWLPFLADIKNACLGLFSFSCIVLRASRIVQKEQKENLDGTIIYGSLAEEEIIFKENNVKFIANVVRGHKTGFFLDHRQNRIEIGKLSRNQRVLDVFSYAGGFSIHALAGGAREVYSVDISEQALKMAQRNATQNEFSGKHITIAGDAFEILEEMIKGKQKFDVVIIDPPSFAKRKTEVERALQKYIELAKLGAKLTNRGGVLLLASCSSRISMNQFIHCHEIAFQQEHIHFELEKIATHDIDHPHHFEELNYLKGVYYRRVEE